MTFKGKTLRRVATIAATASALLTAATGVAHASPQSAVLAPDYDQTFATYFFGRTQVCVTDLSTSPRATFSWASGPSSGESSIGPGQTWCLTRSFVGLPMWIWNTSVTATSPVGDSYIKVTFPFGP